MNYQFIIAQINPQHRDWHFLVWIDEIPFRAECEQRRIASDFSHPSWPYEANSWEGIIADAAIDTVHNLLGVTSTVGFAPSGIFSASNTPGPFTPPTEKQTGFELLLLNK